MRRLYGDSSGTTPSESLSYTYTGPKRNTWTYDAHGNVTADPQAGLGIEWNAIGLPRTITASSGTDTASTQRFYLADGSLAQVSDGTTTRLYLGDMVFEKAANGTVTLESAGWEGGRLLPGTGADKILYVVKDHLGSVRVVKDGTGAVRQRFDYYPYGTVSRVWTSSATTDDSEKRYRFGGKEVAGSALTDLAGEGSATGAPYLDFGARMYSPSNMCWMTMDPLAEKYYHISPYAYCAGNPVNLAVPDGMDYWILSRDGTIVNVLSSETTCMLFAVETSECYQDGTDTIFRQLAFNSHERIEDNEKYKVSFASNLSGNDALSLFKFLSDNTNVEWAMHGTTEFTIGTTHNKSSCGEWSWYGLDSRPKFSIHSHPGDEYTTDYEQRYSAGNDWRAMQNNPESKAKYYYIYFPVTDTYSQLKLDYMYPMGPLPSVYNKIKKR